MCARYAWCAFAATTTQKGRRLRTLRRRRRASSWNARPTQGEGSAHLDRENAPTTQHAGTSHLHRFFGAEARGGSRWDGEIEGKRAQIVQPITVGSCQAPLRSPWIFREYADEPGLFQYLGTFDELSASHPAIARVVEPFLSHLETPKP